MNEDDFDLSTRISSEYGTLLLYSPTLLQAETDARIAADTALQNSIDNEVVHLAGTETITGAKSFSEAITATGGLKDADVSTAIKLGDSGNTVPTTGNKTIVGAINELNTKTSGGGVAPLPTYLTAVPSSIVGTYNQLNYSLPAPEIILNATVNNNEALIKSFIYGMPLDTTTIPAGNWAFQLFTYVSSTTQTTTIRAEIFKRTSGGAETTLFTVSSNDISLTSVGQIKLESFQNAFTVNATDYLGARFYAITTAPINITVYLYTGNGNPTYITTPLSMRHDLLRDIKYVSNNKSGALHMTNGADTIYGVKTFNASPIVPIPTTDYQAANKKYVDDNAGGGGSSILPTGTCSTAGATAAKEVTITGYTETAGACALITFANKNTALGPALYIPFTGGTAADPLGVYTLTTIGSPTYTGDKFNSNGNSGLKYNMTSLGSGAWCIQGTFNFSSIGSRMDIIRADNNGGLGVIIVVNTNGTIALNLSFNGTTNNQNTSTLTLSPNTQYLIKVYFTGSVYKTDVSVDNGATWTTYCTYTSSSSVNGFVRLCFGISEKDGNIYPLIGTMDDLYVSIGSDTIADALTLNINGSGAKSILHADGTRVTPANPAYFIANCPIQFCYDGTGYRFKQERVNSYVNGINWYNLYNNGWVEQGGIVSVSSEQTVTVSLLQPMNDTNYHITASTMGFGDTYVNTQANTYELTVFNLTETGFSVRMAGVANRNKRSWQVSGMAA